MHLCVDRLQETLHVGPSHSLELLHPALGQDQAPQSLAELLLPEREPHPVTRGGVGPDARV
jgi:hypothetical protein